MTGRPDQTITTYQKFCKKRLTLKFIETLKNIENIILGERDKKSLKTSGHRKRYRKIKKKVD